jgi:uncharacterized protein
MEKKVYRFLWISFLFLCVLQSACWGAEAASTRKNFLWKVRSDTTTVYLLGSVHFMKKEIYPLNRKIEEAFEKAELLVVEANVNDVGKIDVGKLIETAFYTGDDTLEKHVSAETYELVKKEFEGLGFPIWIINKQKPWFLALSCTSLELMKQGFDPTYGLDMHFLNEASGKKRIKELESVDYQIHLLSGFSDSEQEAFLRYTLKEIHSVDKEVDQVVNAWKNGDEKGMEAVTRGAFQDNATIASVYGKLIHERNRNMASKIEEYLHTGETYFVVVGAAHLIGNRGILELLRMRGYTVTQL